MSGAPDADAQERHRAARRQALAWQGGTEAFVAILICMGIGYWADGRFDTSPILLLIGTAIGFASFVLRLLRLGRQLERIRTERNADAGPAGRTPR